MNTTEKSLRFQREEPQDRHYFPAPNRLIVREFDSNPSTFSRKGGPNLRTSAFVPKGRFGPGYGQHFRETLITANLGELRRFVMTSLIGFACYLPLILALATLVRWEYKRMRRARLSRERLEAL